MELRRLGDIIAFDERRMLKHRVFETDRTLTDLYCLDPDQEQLLLVHEASDKVLVVMAGRVLVRVEDESAEVAQYETVLVPGYYRSGEGRKEGALRMLRVLRAPGPVPYTWRPPRTEDT